MRLGYPEILVLKLEVGNTRLVYRSDYPTSCQYGEHEAGGATVYVQQSNIATVHNSTSLRCAKTYGDQATPTAYTSETEPSRSISSDQGSHSVNCIS